MDGLGVGGLGMVKSLWLVDGDFEAITGIVIAVVLECLYFDQDDC